MSSGRRAQESGTQLRLSDAGFVAVPKRKRGAGMGKKPASPCSASSASTSSSSSSTSYSSSCKTIDTCDNTQGSAAKRRASSPSSKSSRAGLRPAGPFTSAPQHKHPNGPRRGTRVRAQRNLATKLQLRELSAAGCTAFKARTSEQRFKGIRPCGILDAHDPGTDDVKLCFLRRRSKVVEIVAAHDLVFGLTQTGICTAFSRTTRKRVCFLNTAPDEVVRSLFYNKSNDSLITVSVFRTDNYSSLKCRSTRIEYIRQQQPEKGFPLFETESLRWPGFVEFDDVNGKVLTYSAKEKVYKIWDLVNYSLLYSIEDKGIQEIKISPGIMLLIYARSACGSHVPLRILSIDSGETLTSFEHALHPERKIDFIEQFNEKLLVKQEDGNLEIIDVRTSERREVPSTDFLTPTAFIFLYESMSFLTFKERSVAVWDFRGELVSRFDDHVLWHPDCNTNNIYISSGQELIISYCKNGDAPTGSINVSDILSGKSVAKIAPPKAGAATDARLLGEFNKGLENVTALFYNEDLNEIYTGNRAGHIVIWSNHR
ncbi:F-box/WD repeat-containing protein 4 [Hondaea fermentalgiana]|uniref:F-box/WD repeat-containing protein 4 n=1 Tax=Hondaea fermentalgiana TaxID=2315210 RepID=A0A2R5G6P2_9STRA|nr:F-box/WD repeat-containing protein 4 [Hondaea fermentalgiana]|eukprot:GBG26722.1 F-box/WD repeat-containing protein 4 [Hondaea fermentalgiana]